MGEDGQYIGGGFGDGVQKGIAREVYRNGVEKIRK